jgi:hypothetical protein
MIAQADATDPDNPDERGVVRGRPRQRKVGAEIRENGVFDRGPIQFQHIDVAERMASLIGVLAEDDTLQPQPVVCLRMNCFIRSIAGAA